MTLLDEFLSAFLTAYRDMRQAFGDEDWQRVWCAPYRSDRNWNHVMLYEDPAHPNPKGTVLRRTAEGMKRHFWLGEPLRLDGAIVPPAAMARGRTAPPIPVPILVAIEHENDVTTFEEEIIKLFYVRCPLKVGITYALLEKDRGAPRTAVRQGGIADTAVRVASALDEHTREDPATTYLYLLGSEDTQYRLTWHALTFTAGSGPTSARWRTIE